jgi:hypothetical protein
MSKSRRLTEAELSGARLLVQGLYPGRTIINVAAEVRQKRPAEEGLDLGEVGLALLLETGEVELYGRVLANELDCYVDTFLEGTDSDSGWLVVVTVLEKYDASMDDRTIEEIECDAGDYKIRATLRPSPGETFELRVHEVRHKSGLSIGYDEEGITSIRNIDKDSARSYLESMQDMYRKTPFDMFRAEAAQYKQRFGR